MAITINLVHYYKNEDEVMDLLRLINHKLTLIMTKQEHIDAAVAGLTASSADISQDLTFLKDQIATGTVTDESIAKVTALAAAFAEIAALTDSSTPPPADQPIL